MSGLFGPVLTAPDAAAGPAIALTATATGKRQAVGLARALSCTSAAGGTLAYRFSDASGAVAVVTGGTNAALSATAVRIPVPTGMPYIEYIRVTGADFAFVAQPLV